MSRIGRPFRIAVLWAASLAGCGAAAAMTSEELNDIALQRLQGDRTGACMAIAVIDNKNPSTAYVCADPKDRGRIDERTAFEIGSISKTFTAALLADQIAAGKMRLDDPLWLYLPEGTKVPGYEGTAITLRHLVTHTSGLPALPPRMVIRNARNPYAVLTERQLLDSLAEVTLTQAPGSEWGYSNFAVMLLSQALSNGYKKDFETAVRERLFTPLGMKTSFVYNAPPGVRMADGHVVFPSKVGTKTSPWDFPVNMAGVGGFRSTLPDMVRYLEANLGLRSAATPAGAAIERTHEELTHIGNVHMGMGWVISPLLGNQMHMHEGHTGGFSSFMAFDKKRQRGVVILADTSFNSLGGLSDLGLHLMDERMPLGKPRVVIAAAPAELDAMAGRYRLDNGTEIDLRRKDTVLEMQVQGQRAYPLGHDSSGDFFPLGNDAILRPQPEVGGYSIAWLQGGSSVVAKRVDAVRRVREPLSSTALSEYAGEYPLRPDLSLRVFVLGTKLWGQASGQGAFPLERVIPDVFFSPQPDVELRFERKEGKVVAMVMRQAGSDLRAEIR